MPKALAFIDEEFSRAVEPYRVISAGIDRHGSWEWSACQRDGLNRYVTLDVLLGSETEPEQAILPLYLFEVWAGADDGHRYWRNLIRRFVGPAIDGEYVSKLLSNTLISARDFADQLDESSLIDSYLELPKRTID